MATDNGYGEEAALSVAVWEQLIVGNRLFMGAIQNPGDISLERRQVTAAYGQFPYAVVLTCSDSRVTPEHIFSAGIGELFVIRTAGNVVGDFEIGSIEYAASSLQVPLIVILGHSDCGAVMAALEGGHGSVYIQAVVHEIQAGFAEGEPLPVTATLPEAIYRNTQHSKERLLQSQVIRELVDSKQLLVVCGYYEMPTGQVYFFTE